MVAEAFGAQPAFASENLARLLTRVKPGFIRVDADEVTYPAHILLRYDIERSLIEGTMEARDIP
jgi:carboxypeptidase Taq